jgi:hypothetical protein
MSLAILGKTPVLGFQGSFTDEATVQVPGGDVLALL